MIALTITTIVVILALVALVVGGLMWDRQGRRDITAPPDWREVPRTPRKRATFTPDDTAEVLDHTQRRIELYQLAMHQLRMDQLERERELVDRCLHNSHSSHKAHPPTINP